MHLGLIGYGTIARALMRLLVREGAGLSRVSVLARPSSVPAVQAALAADFAGRFEVMGDPAQLVAAQPWLVVESAGHAAVRDTVPALLRAGIETVIVSVGALADEALHQQVQEAARAGGTRVVLPAGAIGGIDLLCALRSAGITRVTYTGRKPPLAWQGTPAERVYDLAALTQETVIFSGTAREAALLYPKNANVAATVALAGAGWEATTVRLIADPAIACNVHDLAVVSQAGDFTLHIEGKPLPDNPKTSAATVHSVAREIFNRAREVAI